MIQQADELYQRGLQACQENNTGQGMEYLQQAADLNHVEAIYELGKRYGHGINVERQIQCYQKAADLGHPGAMNVLGYFLAFRGDSPLPKDPHRARKLFEKSYELDKNTDAFIYLVKLYAEGCKEPEFPKNIPKAMSLLVQADKELSSRDQNVNLKASIIFRETVSHQYKHIFSFVVNLMEDNQKLQEQVLDLQKENKHLEAQILYQPDGPGYLEAKEEFENLQVCK